jgi:hypothetical protein
MSPAGIDALTWFDDTKVVVCPTLFHWTEVDSVRLHPQTASGNLGPPATAELGINDEIDGGADEGHAPAPGPGHTAGVGMAVGVAVGVGLPTGEPTPTPSMLMVKAFLLAPLLIVSFAVFLPSDDGLKMIDTSQSSSAARLPTQFWEGVNSISEDATELISTGTELGF